MTGLFESYLLKMAQFVKAGVNSDAQSMGIVANAYYLADDLMPRVWGQFKKHSKQECPELETFTTKLYQLFEALRDSFCQKRSVTIISDVMKWQIHAQLYSASTFNQDPAVAHPSPGFTELIRYLCRLKDAVDKHLSPDFVDQIVRMCLEELMNSLFHGPNYWNTLTIGYGGLQQMVLDIRFCLAASRGYVTEACASAAHRIIHRAVHYFCKVNPHGGDAGSSTETREAREATLERSLMEEPWMAAVIEGVLKPKVGSSVIPLAAYTPGMGKAKKSKVPEDDVEGTSSSRQSLSS